MIFVAYSHADEARHEGLIDERKVPETISLILSIKVGFKMGCSYSAAGSNTKSRMLSSRA
jgi:hypothetical protein